MMMGGTRHCANPVVRAAPLTVVVRAVRLAGA